MEKMADLYISIERIFVSQDMLLRLHPKRDPTPHVTINSPGAKTPERDFSSTASIRVSMNSACST